MKFTLFAFILFLLFPNFAFTETDHSEHSQVVETKAEKEIYQCPMHPNIISDKPGNCPICGMRLVKVEGIVSSKASGLEDHSNIRVSPERRQLIGLTTSAVEERDLKTTLHVAGHVAYNPDLYDTLGEYREAFEAYRRTRKSSNPIARERADELMKLAELKLRLAGFSKEQSEQVMFASGGYQYFSSGVFVPPNLDLSEGAVWVNADVYEPDSELVKPGQKVSLTAPALPGEVFYGEVKTVDPVFNAMTRIARVRLEVLHQDKLKPGMTADVGIEIPLGKKLAVSSSAIFNTGDKQLVFVDKGNGEIEPRQVRAGFFADGYYEILSGLEAGEKVADSATLLVDSESRMRAAVQSFHAGHQHESVIASEAKQSRTEIASPPAGVRNDDEEQK